MEQDDRTDGGREALGARERPGGIDHDPARPGLLAEQVTGLQATIDDLVSASPLDEVLGRIAARAAGVLGAARYLLTVRPLGTVEPVVRHGGFDDADEAMATAAEVMAQAPGEGESGARLVVEVTSARRHYGRLAMVFDGDRRLDPEEHRLLAAHARQAAAALDAGAALHEAARERDATAALVGLARSVMDAKTVEEVADRVAASVPAVVGVSRACVLLWDTADRVFRVAGTHGYAPELDARLRSLPVHPTDTPEALRMVTQPQARVIRRDDGDEYTRIMLDAFGAEAAGVAPILVGKRLLGTVAADWAIDAQEPWGDAHLIDRLRAVGDQAAIALENIRLLEDVRRQAFGDELTGLPNHMLFRDRVQQALARAERHGERLAVLYLDVDHFKKVNDSLGPTAGNELLVQVAARLRAALRAQDTVARMGGDEFAVLLPTVESVGGAGTVAEKLLGTFSDPFQIDRHTVFVTASIGLALYPDHGFGVETLLRNADVAMYRAKEHGRNTHQWYAASMTARAHERIELEAELHRALEEGGLRVLYQPIFDLRAGRMVAVEALVRWDHPTRGVLTPDRFLAMAEEAGLIVSVDAWVLREACLQARAWLDEGLQPLRIAVNISGPTFQQPRLIDTVFQVVREAGLEPGALELEVSENVAGHEARETMSVLEKLRALGVRVAIDDFGTGYSVLSRLRGFPLNTMKVDKTFVDDIAAAADQGPIVAGLIAMAHSLSVEVTAEGVETAAQMSFLRRHGCDNVQGFLLARPVEAEIISRLAREAVPVATDST
jgi:diguanylate cyclase (GGDEF)-like protein